MQIAYLGLQPGKVKKPPPFKLKDLPKYSKTLKIRDIEGVKFSSVLGKK